MSQPLLRQFKAEGILFSEKEGAGIASHCLCAFFGCMAIIGKGAAGGEMFLRRGTLWKDRVGMEGQPSWDTLETKTLTSRGINVGGQHLDQVYSSHLGHGESVGL